MASPPPNKRARVQLGSNLQHDLPNLPNNGGWPNRFSKSPGNSVLSSFGLNHGHSSQPATVTLLNLQERLTQLLHSLKCQSHLCQQSNCKALKSVIGHMSSCRAGRSCQVALCESSRRVIHHYKTCARTGCAVCSISTQSYNGQEPGMSASSGPPVPAQPSQAEMEKAYNSLGLKMPVSSATSNQAFNPPMLQSHLQPCSMSQAMATPQSVCQVSPQHCSTPMQSSNNANIGGSNTVFNFLGGQSHNMPPRPMLSHQRVPKEWQRNIFPDLRKHQVNKLVQAIFPAPHHIELQDRRMSTVLKYAHKMENDIYEQADSQDEYYNLLAEKLCKIQKELEEKHKLRQLQQQQQLKADSDISEALVGEHQLPSVSSVSSSDLDMGLHRAQGSASLGSATGSVEAVTIISKSGGSMEELPDLPFSKPAVKEPISALDEKPSYYSSGSEDFKMIKEEMHTPTNTDNVCSNVVDFDTENFGADNDSVGSVSGIKQEFSTVEKKTVELSNFKGISAQEEEDSLDMKEEDNSTKTESPGPSLTDFTKDKCVPDKNINDGTSKPDKFTDALMPILQSMYDLEPESLPFREPVDPIALGIPDYLDVIKKPMDLSTIRNRLESGEYKDPWDFLDDVWLMLDNAWLYNKKNSRVYKFCTKLSEVFEADIENVMRNLGYCCGRKYVFNPQVLCCFGKQLCTIPKDAVFYSYEKRYFYCEKCFKDIKGEQVELSEGPLQPSVSIKKEDFLREKNDHVEQESYIKCKDCGRRHHQICALHLDQIWPSGYVCDNCLNIRNEKRPENKYSSKRLPSSRLGTYLEKRVNAFLKSKDFISGRVNVRVLATSDQSCEVKPGMRNKFVDTGEMNETFPFRSKAIFAFEEVDGEDLCFFAMYVQEYGSDCPQPNSRRVYVAYLDSVHFFQPKEFRTAVYHELLIGYLGYAKTLGYTMAHIWACPPSEGDDYIFHCHPPEQKTPKPKRLQEWYKKMLDKAIVERIVIDYKDILKDTVENGVTSCSDLPYFEGDFWPGVLEDTIKQMDQEEEEERRKLLELEAVTGGFEAPHNDNIFMDSGGKKKGQKNAQKKKGKRKNNPRKSASKVGTPCGDNDLFHRLFLTLEKHKEMFFVVRLHTIQDAVNLPPIQDSDPLISNEVIESRDSFLALAKEKHLEFSSFRRTKYSTMAILYDLHNQGKETYVITCNKCSAEVELHYHCNTCEDYDLCVNCYQKIKHEHEMNKVGPQDFTEDSSSQEKPQDPQVVRQQTLQHLISALLHACQCRDANCHLPRCQRLKRSIAHMNICKKKTSGNCSICKQLLNCCYLHAKSCQEVKCPVILCPRLKKHIKQQNKQSRMQQDQLLRRRMAMMNQSNYNRSNSNSSADNQSAVLSQASQPHPDSKKDGKLISTAPMAAISAAQEAQIAAQRQAYISQSQNALRPPPATKMVSAQSPSMHPSQSMPMLRPSWSGMQHPQMYRHMQQLPMQHQQMQQSPLRQQRIPNPGPNQYPQNPSFTDQQLMRQNFQANQYHQMQLHQQMMTPASMQPSNQHHQMFGPAQFHSYPQRVQSVPSHTNSYSVPELNELPTDAMPQYPPFQTRPSHIPF